MNEVRTSGGYMKFLKNTSKKYDSTKKSNDDIRNTIPYLFIMILLICALMLVYLSYSDMNRIYNDNLNEIEIKLKETSNNISYVMDYSIKSLNLLEQVLVDSHTFSSDDTDIFNDFEFNNETNQYYYPVDNQVSISGIGNLQNLSESLKSDLLTAMQLTPYFEIAKNDLPSIQWIYFISNQHFINLYPPAEAKDYLFEYHTFWHR